VLGFRGARLVGLLVPALRRRPALGGRGSRGSYGPSSEIVSEGAKEAFDAVCDVAPLARKVDAGIARIRSATLS